MRGHLQVLLLASTALLPSLPRVAHAQEPSKRECLGASEASLKLASDHKLRAERSQLLICASSSCPKVIREECLSRVSEVNTEVPTLILGAKDATGADLTAVKVTMDGEVLVDHLDGSAIAVDPGAHSFVFETAGQSRVDRKLVIEQAQKDRREIVVFGAPVLTPGSTSLRPAPLDAGATPPPPSTSGPLGTQRVAALVAGGAGVIGLGVGTIFGALALAQKSSAESACPGASCPTQDGANKWSTASSSGTVSTVGLIVGGVLVAGGAVLWFTAPHPSGRPTPQVGIGPGSVQASVTW